MADPTAVIAAESAFRTYFAGEPVRASVSFVGVEPIDVLRFDSADGNWVYVTLGMSRHSMTPPEQIHRDESGPRAELVVQTRATPEAFDDLWRQLAVMAAAPAVEGLVYGTDQTVDLGTPLAVGSRCTGGIVVASGFRPVPVGAGVTEILRVIPATPTELAWCRVHGAQALQERWATHGTDLLDLARPSVRLD